MGFFALAMRWLVLFFFSMPIALAASLTPIETQIIDNVKKQRDTQQTLLIKLVEINSGTMNIAGVKRTGELVRRQLNQLGFKTRWVNEPQAFHRAPTLIAERHGKKGKHLLLIGHLDTVFASTSSFKKFERHQHSAKGPGVVDDKGGVVVMLYALNALQQAHLLNDTTITVVLTGDEEDSGKPTAISRKPLIDAAKNCEVALDFEPAMNLETATIGRRGITLWTLQTQGNQSHSATIFQKDVGDGAIFAIAYVLNNMREQLKDIKNLSFNPGLIAGGTQVDYDKTTAKASVFGKENVVAKTSLVKGDFRFVDTTQKQLVEDKMTAIAKQTLEGTKATIHFEDGIPAMAPTAANLALLERYSEVSLALGDGSIKPFDPALRGAGDISYVAAMVPANLAGLGPVGYGTHSVLEAVELASLPVQTRRAALLIYRLTQ